MTIRHLYYTTLIVTSIYSIPMTPGMISVVPYSSKFSRAKIYMIQFFLNFLNFVKKIFVKVTVCINHIGGDKKICDQIFRDLTAFTKFTKFIALENLELYDISDIYQAATNGNDIHSDIHTHYMYTLLGHQMYNGYLCICINTLRCTISSMAVLVTSACTTCLHATISV